MNLTRSSRSLTVRTYGPVPTRIPICNTNVLVVSRPGGEEQILTGCWASPGKAFIFWLDAVTGEQGRWPLPAGEPGAYALVQAPDGYVYVGGGVGSLFRVDLASGEIAVIRERALRGIIWAGLATSGGHVYMQANPGEVIEYVIASDSFALLRHCPTPDSHYGHSWCELPDGRAVCGLSVPRAALAVYRPGAGLERIVPIPEAHAGWIRIRGSDAAGRVVVSTQGSTLLLLDAGTLEPVDRKSLPEGAGDLVVDGEMTWAWQGQEGRLYRDDGNGWTACGQASCSGERRLGLRPGGGVVAVSREGDVSIHDASGKLEREWALETEQAGAMLIHALGAAPGGRAYGATFINQRFFAVDLEGGDLADLGRVHGGGGQTNAVLWQRGKLYLASYTKAEIHAYDPQRPVVLDVNPAAVLRCGHEQMRPISLVECAGALWMSSHAEYGVHGGALSRLEISGDSVRSAVHRDVVPGCNLEHLAAWPEESLLVAGTTIQADCRSAPPVAAQAAVVIWDAGADALAAVLGEELGRESLDVLAVTPQGLAPVFCGKDLWILDVRARTLAGPHEFPLGPCRHLTRYRDEMLIGSAGEDLFLWDVAAGSLEVWPGEGGTYPVVIGAPQQAPQVLLARPDATVRLVSFG